jgi:hypothetical protein
MRSCLQAIAQLLNHGQLCLAFFTGFYRLFPGVVPHQLRIEHQHTHTLQPVRIKKWPAGSRADAVGMAIHEIVITNSPESGRIFEANQ